MVKREEKCRLVSNKALKDLSKAGYQLSSQKWKSNSGSNLWNLTHITKLWCVSLIDSLLRVGAQQLDRIISHQDGKYQQKFEKDFTVPVSAN